jgi:putative hydrolase of the HAD superfamily
MIEAIVFDFGKVLGFFDHGRTLAKLAPFTDMPPQEIYATIYCAELEDAFESGRLGEAEFFQRFRAQCRLRCDDAFLAAAVADIFWPNEPLCQLVPHLKPRYRLVLGSNTNPTHARQFVPQFADTLRHFDGVVLSHEVGVRKPRAEFFDHCLRYAGAGPERCLFVDDLPANVAGAVACGWQGIVYTGVDALCADLRRLGVHLPSLPTGSNRLH